MSKKENTKFKVDYNKCIECGNCTKVCSGMVLDFDENHHIYMKDFDRFGWNGCWRCQHCLAVCPTGAISIFGKDPANSLPKPDPDIGEQMARLVVNRRSCRRYKKENVDPAILDEILSAMQTIPTGGNSRNVEFTVIDDYERVQEIWNVAYSRMEELAKKHQYTTSLSDFYYKKLKLSEKEIRKGDFLFCGAPHLFIAHEKCEGKWADDSKINCNIATAYFELLANAYGLGTVIMSTAGEVIEQLVPEAKEMLGIPKNHYMKLIVGFGYPEIEYQRGVQRKKSKNIHRYSQLKK